MNDQIGSSHMIQGSLTSFVTDRFGNANSALALNGGWTQVPSGVYFDTPEFTISVWIYPLQVSDWSRIIDFGNGQFSNTIIVAISSVEINDYNLLVIDSLPYVENRQYEMNVSTFILTLNTIKKLELTL